MLKRNITFVLLTGVFAVLHAQDPHFSNFWATPYYINPSFISALTDPVAGATYRNQWPGLSSAYVTYGAFFSQPVENLNSTIGLSLLHDIQGDGVLTRTGFNALYSYAIKINKQVSLSAGLQLSYNINKVNTGKLVFESDLTGSNPGTNMLGNEKISSGFADFVLGFTAFIGENFFTGFSAHHLTKARIDYSESYAENLYPRYIFQVGGNLSADTRNYKDKIIFKPGLQLQLQDKYTELLYGSSAVINPFVIGLWARNDLKFNFDALILLAGFSRNEYNFYYSYDVNMKNMHFFSPGIGAHEVTFLYKFKYNEKRKKYRAIKCSDI